MNARCPMCRNVRPAVFDLRGRLTFSPHSARNGRRWLPCPGSGWLVEDDELVTKRTRGPHNRATKRAQP